MSNKQLAIFGIVSWLLSIVALAQNSAGNYIAPVFLIAISGIALLVFRITAIIRLLRLQKVTAILFIITSLGIIIRDVATEFLGLNNSSLILSLNIMAIIDFVLFIWVVSLLTLMGRRDNLEKKLQKDLGLTDDEFSSVQRDAQKENYQETVQKNTIGQVQYRVIFDYGTVVDAKDCKQTFLNRRIDMRKKLLQFIYVIGWGVGIALGIWSYILDLIILRSLVTGFWFYVIAFIVPGPYIIVPWYALFVFKNWLPLATGYGGLILLIVLFYVGKTLENIDQDTTNSDTFIR